MNTPFEPHNGPGPHARALTKSRVEKPLVHLSWRLEERFRER